jgi:hypothetical protein
MIEPVALNSSDGLEISRRLGERLQRKFDPEENKIPLSEVRSTVFELRRLPEYSGKSWRDLAREAIQILEEIEIERQQHGEAKVYSGKTIGDFSGSLSRFCRLRHIPLLDLTRLVTGYGKKEYVERVALFLKEELKVTDFSYIDKNGVPSLLADRVASLYPHWSKAKLGSHKSKSTKKEKASRKPRS